MKQNLKTNNNIKIKKKGNTYKTRELLNWSVTILITGGNTTNKKLVFCLQ